MKSSGNLEKLKADVNAYATAPLSKYVQSLVQSTDLVRKRKNEKIKFSPPILVHQAKAILFPNTINVIQGKTGVHKSRLAEIFASVLITEENDKTLLGFNSNLNEELLVIYLDTERNLKDQFPAAIQSILHHAGFQRSDNPESLGYTSLINIDRTERFRALEQYLEHIRTQCDTHLLIILDVLSDCISDFNSAEESLKMIDMMNKMINDSNVTFLAIIHENPNGNKARGHLGTELTNKASTVIQVSFDDDKDAEQSDILKINFKKCRSTGRYNAMYAKYCPEQQTLVSVSPDQLPEKAKGAPKKAKPQEVKNFIRELLSNQNRIQKSELIDRLASAFSTSPNTIRKRITEIVETEEPIVDRKSGKTMSLKEERIKKEVWVLLSTTNLKILSPE